MKVSHEWHKSFFKNSFYNPASPAAVAKAPQEIAFVLKKLKLKKGAKVLDLCCGPARHSVLLAKKGFEVTGYDYSAEYLKEAAQRTKKAKVKLRLMRGDMRRLKFTGDFDAAINLFTSFGYFQRKSDDIKTLKGAARALKPGGKFIIDIINGDFVHAHFRPRNWQELKDGSYHLEESAYHKDGIINHWTRIKNGKILKRSFFSRMYTRKTMSAALRRAGLKPLKFWGSFQGAPLTPARNRLIVLAKKIWCREKEKGDADECAGTVLT